MGNGNQSSRMPYCTLFVTISGHEFTASLPFIVRIGGTSRTVVLLENTGLGLG